MRGNLFLRLIFVGAMALSIVSCSKQGEANSAQNSSRGSAESVGGSTSGQQKEPALAPVMNSALPPLTDLRQFLDSSNQVTFWTRRVDWSGVTVQRNLHDEGFILVGPDNDHTVLVRLEKAHPELREGQKVDLTGIVDPMGKDLSQWNVKPADREVFQGHTMFISASLVKANGTR